MIENSCGHYAWKKKHMASAYHNSGPIWGPIAEVLGTVGLD
jgi:hypothetical protein